MGYSTTFTTEFVIDNMSGKEAIDINCYMAKDHTDSPVLDEYKIYTRWCDWRIDINDDDRYTLVWNDSEKSYDMDKWLKHIVKDYFIPNGIVLNGYADAQGEDPDDRWRLLVVNNEVKKLKAKIIFDEDEEEI